MGPSGEGPQGRLTTHILDTANGCPGRGIAISLYRIEEGVRHHLCDALSNEDGRVDSPLLQGAAMVPGRYELTFAIGDYFAARGAKLADPPFLDVVVIAFAIADAHAHYHVPLLASPWGYTTYRGS